MYKYNKQKHEVVKCIEPPFIPELLTKGSEEYNWYAEKLKEYELRKASPESYPVQGEVKWLDGQEVEEGKDYFLHTRPFVAGNYLNKCSECGNQFRGTDKLWFLCQDCCAKVYAYPLQQAESEDELLDEVVGIIIKASTYKSMGAIQEFRDEMQKLKSFSITRKQ